MRLIKSPDVGKEWSGVEIVGSFKSDFPYDELWIGFYVLA